ncbi:hypothetical protein EON62_02930 [archaeon]|nr:MAG: hypothetical protein EON62_02930 [archaeon]
MFTWAACFARAGCRVERVNGMASEAAPAAPVVKNHNKYRRDKPWDVEGTDHWAIEVRLRHHFPPA